MANFFVGAGPRPGGAPSFSKRKNAVDTPGPPLLGLRNFLGELSSMPAGFVQLARQILPGAREDEPGNREFFSEFGKGMAKSAISTAAGLADLPTGGIATLLTAGKLGPKSGPITGFLQDVIPGEEYDPVGMGERIQERGLLSVLAEDIGNVAIVAGGAGVLAKAAGAPRLAASLGKISRPIRTTGEFLTSESMLPRMPQFFQRGVTTIRTKEAQKLATRQLSADQMRAQRELQPAAQRAVVSFRNNLPEESGIDVNTMEELITEHVRAELSVGDTIGMRDQLQTKLRTRLAGLEPEQQEVVLRTLAKPEVRSSIDSLVTTTRAMRGDVASTLKTTVREGQGIPMDQAAATVLEVIQKQVEKRVGRTQRLRGKTTIQLERLYQEIAQLETEKFGRRTKGRYDTPEAAAQAQQRAADLRRQAAEATDPAEVKRLRREAQKLEAPARGARYGQGRQVGVAEERLRGLRRRADELESRKSKLEEIEATTTAETYLPSVREVGKFAPEWQPIWAANLELAEQLVKTSGIPDSAATKFIAEQRMTFPAVLERAIEAGFNPTHIADLSPAQVKRLAFGNLTMEPEFALPMTRRRRTGGRAAGGELDLSLAQFIASSVDAMREVRSQELLKTLTDIGAVTKVGEGGVMPGHFAFRGTTEGLLDLISGKNVGAGDWQIHEGLARSLRHMNKDYSHTVWSSIDKAVTPWRTAVLTYSPMWYVNSAMGNFINASAGGVKMRDWFSAFRKRGRGWHGRFPEVSERLLSGAGLKGELGDTAAGALLYPEGNLPRAVVEMYQDARAAGGNHYQAFKGSLKWTNSVMQRANQWVDEFARVAMFEKGVREGLPLHQAIAKAEEGLVNFANMTPFERTVLRNIIPFYSWQKGILRLTGRLAYDEPARFRVMMLLGQVNNEAFMEEQATLPEFYRGAIPFGSMYLRTRSFNPFADSLSLLTPEGISESLNPLLEILVKRGFDVGHTPFGPKRVGPTGFAEDVVSVPDELLNLGVFSPIGGAIRSFRGEAASASPIPFFPFSTEQRVRQLQARKRQAEQQVAEGLPLPPPQRQQTFLAPSSQQPKRPGQFRYQFITQAGRNR